MPPKKATSATAPVQRATKITRRPLVATASKPSRNTNAATHASTLSSTSTTVRAAPQRQTNSKKALTSSGKRTSTTAASTTAAAAASVAAKAKQSSGTRTTKRSRTATAAPQRVEPAKKAARKDAASTQQADNEKDVGPSTASTLHDETPAQASRTTSLLQRYLPSPSAVDASLVTQPWNVRDAVVFSTFLATLQLHFVRSCCRLLARLTTATSPAFLHAAALGEAALRPVNDAPARSGRDGGVSSDVDQLVDRQELAYRTIRATIAASCTLGHRSCQVLWGPRGSGKHRILRLLAQDVRRTPKTFVVELHGALLRDDEAALGVIAQQLLTFLLSPQSQSLRQAHYLLRTGSFGFGQLFHFERRMQEAAAASGGGGAAASGPGAAKSSHKTGARRGMHITRNNEASADSDADEDADVEGDDADDAGMMVTSTTTYLTGGAASALPHLQRALLLLKSHGCNIVVCIRDIDVFGIRCDQLLYVLSGLMHDSDGSHGGSSAASSGGGLSLVLASAAPDIRQLEKRLSSRLTCETRYVPLLPWSLPGLMAATLHVAQLDAASQLQIKELMRQRTDLLMHLRDGATRLRRVCEAPAADAAVEEGKRNGRGGGAATSAAAARKAKEKAMTEVQTLMAALEARLHATEASLRDVRAQRRHELGSLDLDAGVSGGSNVQEGGGSSSGSHNSTTNSIVWSGTSGTALRDAAASGWRWQPTESNRTTATAAPTASQQSATSSPSLVLPRSWTLDTLLSHSSLPLETQCVLCEELLRQLRRGCKENSSRSSSSRIESGEASDSLARRIVFLSDAVENESATSATVLTVLTSMLCKTASGAVDLLGDAGRRVLLVWMRGRLQHEAIPLPPPPLPSPSTATAAAAAAAAAVEKAVDFSACPPGLPEKVLTQWRGAAQALVPFPLPTEAGGIGESKGTELRGAFRLNSLSDADAPANAAATAPATTPSLPLLSLLPPHIFDLFADGQLVGMGYGSREMVLVLIYMHLHHTTGLRQRTVADLLEDVSSSLGTRAAAALDREAFRHAIRSLCRWRLLTVVEGPSQVVQLCGSDARLREFLLTVLAKQTGWCEAELGLDAREIMRFRNLV